MKNYLYFGGNILFPISVKNLTFYTFCCLTTLKRNVRFFSPDFGTSKGHFYGSGCLVMR